MIIVWGRANSLNVQKVIWTLGELGLTYERIDAGGPFGVNDTPDYKRMNPNGRVPVIKDGDFVLWESNAIVRYLCETYAIGPSPRTPNIRALADQWMDWQTTTLWPAMHPVFHALVRGRVPDGGEARIARGIEEAEGLLVLLDTHLATRSFLAGEMFTMADIPAGLTVNRWKKMPVEQCAHEAVDRWFDMLCTRSAFREHLELAIS